MIYHSHPKHEFGSTTDTLDDLRETVEDTIRTLRKHADDFDAIIVTGMSGVLVGSPVSIALQKPLIVVRKQDEDRHQFAKLLNGERCTSRMLFLDDFTCTGDTLYAVDKALEKRNKQYVYAIEQTWRKAAKIVAMYFYRDEDYRLNESTDAPIQERYRDGKAAHPDACDRCHAVGRELYYNGVSGLSVCEYCDFTLNAKEDSECPF